MIQVDNLAKRWGTQAAAGNVAFTVRPGMVTRHVRTPCDG